MGKYKVNEPQADVMSLQNISIRLILSRVSQISLSY